MRRILSKFVVYTCISNGVAMFFFKDTLANCVDLDTKFYGWLGGKKRTCDQPFYWMTSTGGEHWLMNYFNWMVGEPNCLYKTEPCLAFTLQDHEVQWKDESCHAKHCPLCESLD